MTTMLKKVVVVGNSLSAWLSAAAIRRAMGVYGTEVNVCTLAEASPNLGNMSLRPEFRDFMTLIGVSEAEFMRTCLANFKLANHFQDWNVHSKDYYHGFGECGTTIKNIQFSQFYARLREQKNVRSADEFSLGAQFAKHNKFVHPNEDPKSILSTLSYGWNINAEAFFQTVKRYCVEQGVRIIQQSCSMVEKEVESSDIRALHLENEQTLTADLFIDCSSDRRLMGSLDGEWHAWSSELPDCRIQSLDFDVNTSHQTSNLVTAKEFGWQQEIPSQQKLTRHYISTKNANLKIPNDNEEVLNYSEQTLSFGTYKKAWLGNCIGIGCGALSLPSICHSELDLAWLGAQALLHKLPTRQPAQALIEEYNNLMFARYNNAKDVSVMHFCIAEQDSSGFWQSLKKASLSKALSDKLITYQNRGKIPKYANEVWPIEEQYSLLMGLTDKPKQLDLMAKQVPIEHLANIQVKMARHIQQICSSTSSHKEYMQTYCYRRDKSGD